jgi:hypothetical protein
MNKRTFFIYLILIYFLVTRTCVQRKSLLILKTQWTKPTSKVIHVHVYMDGISHEHVCVSLVTRSSLEILKEMENIRKEELTSNLDWIICCCCVLLNGTPQDE